MTDSFLFELGLCLAALLATVVVQMLGLTMIAEFVVRREQLLHRSRPRAWGTLIMGAVACLLFLLHLSQIGIYALLYLVSGAISPFSTAFYFSAVTFATIGYGDIPTEESWRIFAALEGLVGVILVGWSVSF